MISYMISDLYQHLVWLILATPLVFAVLWVISGYILAIWETCLFVSFFEPEICIQLLNQNYTWIDILSIFC